MNEGKKVVLIGSAYPLRGGLASFNERIIREYQNLGHQAELYTFSLQYPGLLFPGKTQYSTEPAPADLKITVRVNSINPFNWIRTGLELYRLKPDLILVKFWIPFMAPCFGTIVRIAKRNKHTRVISIVDNIIPHEHRPGDHILAKYWVNSADGFIAMSAIVRDDLKKFNASKPVKLCYHPIYDNYGPLIPKQEALARLNLSDQYRYILFFGFIRDYKGLDLLLEAISDKRIREMPVKLVIAGEFYCDPKPYLDQIERLNLHEKVILSNDFIPESRVGDYFCASDLVVQPYKSATQSGVTQIAYNFNKPMIVTNVGGLEEFVTNGKVGFVVDPEKSAVADAIVDFYTGGREDVFIANVESEKKRFSWSNMISAIQEILDNLKS